MGEDPNANDATDASEVWLDDIIAEAALPLANYVLEAAVIVQSFAVCDSPSKRMEMCHLFRKLVDRYQAGFGIREDAVEIAYDLGAKIFPDARTRGGAWLWEMDSAAEDIAIDAARRLNVRYGAYGDLEDTCDESAIQYLSSLQTIKVVASVMVSDDLLAGMGVYDPKHLLVGCTSRLQEQFTSASLVVNWGSSGAGGRLPREYRFDRESPVKGELPSLTSLASPLSQEAMRQLTSGGLAELINRGAKVPAEQRVASEIINAIGQDRRKVSRSQDDWAGIMKCSKGTVNRAMKRVRRSAEYQQAITVREKTE